MVDTVDEVMKLKTLKASQVIAQLKKLIKQHGDLNCYQMRQRDALCPIVMPEVEGPGTNWDNAPRGKFILID